MDFAAIRLHAAVLAGGLLAVAAWSGCAGTLADPAAFMEAPAEAGASAQDAAPTAEAGADAPVGGCEDVPSLFVASCGGTGCHDATSKAQALDLVSPGVASRLVGVHATEGAGLLIDPSNPSASVVYTKLLASPPFGARMPTGSKLDDTTIGCVYDWVAGQANLAPGGTDGGTGTPVDAGHSDGASDGGSVGPFSIIRVAAGQTASVTDGQGQTWKADADYTGGMADVETTQVAIAGTDAPVLYNGQRYGNPSFSYAFSVPNGNYTVTLKYAELFVTGPGMRLFDVAVNGTKVATAFDIYAAAGAMNTAVDESYPVTVTSGAIQLDFEQGSIQFPKVDAIAITQGSPGDAGP
ncbi:MAG TPA: malectin [Polyangiaceae bacterium]